MLFGNHCRISSTLLLGALASSVPLKKRTAAFDRTIWRNSGPRSLMPQVEQLSGQGKLTASLSKALPASRLMVAYLSLDTPDEHRMVYWVAGNAGRWASLCSNAVKSDVSFCETE